MILSSLRNPKKNSMSATLNKHFKILKDFKILQLRLSEDLQ